MAFGLSAGAISLIGTGVGAVTGLLSSGGSNGGGGQAQTNTKEPWAEASPWLKRQIKDGQLLQDRYTANPFNSQQKSAYQNTFNDLDSYRNNVAPGIMDFVNSTMKGPGYQRQMYERPGQAGYGPRQPQQPQPQQQPGGVLTVVPPRQPQDDQAGPSSGSSFGGAPLGAIMNTVRSMQSGSAPGQPQRPGGLLENAQGGPSSADGPGLMNQGSRYAPLDFSTPSIPPRAEAPQAGVMTPEMADEFMRRLEQQGLDRVQHPNDGGGA